jgi:drug/metabolite transporter (DMT)-like permease
MNRETIGLLLGFLGVCIFGATLPATRIAVSELAPWFVTSGRAAVAGALALCVLALLRKPVPGKDEWLRFITASACLVVGFPGFIGLAMQTVPASHGGVVLGIMPLATAIFGSILSEERPSLAFWICGALGAAVVVGFTLRESSFQLSLGDVYLFGGIICTAIGYVISAELTQKRPGWEVISWQVVVALPLTVPLALWLMPAAPASIGLRPWLGFAYLALFSQYIGFFAWNAGLALGGVARVSQVQLLQTFVTLGVAALVLGEHVGIDTLLFAVLVICIVLMGRIARIRRA